MYGEIIQRLACRLGYETSPHYLATAFITVPSSELTVTLPAEWGLSKPPSWSFLLDTHLLCVTLSGPSDICSCQRGRHAPLVYMCNTYTLASAETVQCAPRPTREVETRLLEYRATHKWLVNYRSALIVDKWLLNLITQLYTSGTFPLDHCRTENHSDCAANLYVFSVWLMYTVCEVRASIMQWRLERWHLDLSESALTMATLMLKSWVFGTIAGWTSLAATTNGLWTLS